MNLPNTLETPFWDFSISYWKHEAARKALMTMQDDFDLPINLVLFALWLSKEQGASIAPYIKQAARLSHEWQDQVVANLRRARRALDQNPALKESVANVELEAEKIEQCMLFNLAQECPPEVVETAGVFLLLDNLNQCLAAFGKKLSEIPNYLVITLVQSTYTELSLEESQEGLATWSSR